MDLLTLDAKSPAPIQPLAQGPQIEGTRSLPTTAHVWRNDIVQHAPFHHRSRVEKRRSRGLARWSAKDSSWPILPFIYHGAFRLWTEASLIVVNVWPSILVFSFGAFLLVSQSYKSGRVSESVVVDGTYSNQTIYYFLWFERRPFPPIVRDSYA